MTNMFYAHGIYSSIVTLLIGFRITCAVSKLNMSGESGVGYLLQEDRRRGVVKVPGGGESGRCNRYAMRRPPGVSNTIVSTPNVGRGS